jgi:hypothetical protein
VSFLHFLAHRAIEGKLPRAGEKFAAVSSMQAAAFLSASTSAACVETCATIDDSVLLIVLPEPIFR